MTMKDKAITPKKFLEEILPKKFKPEKAAGFDVVAQLNLSGPNGGNWIIIIKNQTLKVAEGTNPKPELTLTLADADFMDLVNGKSSTMKAFLNGKINFSGSFGLALRLRDAGILDFGQ